MYAIKIIDRGYTHSTHVLLADAAAIARDLNKSRGYQYCYVWGKSEGKPYNPDYVGTRCERSSSLALATHLNPHR